MKIAITADLHLRSREETPDRFQVLVEILKTAGAREVDLLIFAGDLFDQGRHNYSDFEAAFRETRPEEVQAVAIPGNHDADLSQKALDLDGLAVLVEPQIVPVDGDLDVLLIPYRQGLTMGEAIAPFAEDLEPERWILVGHGDWAQGRRAPDPYEPGVYMPLTRSDLEAFNPMKAFLGHLHLPYDSRRVHYPGSPCPLNVNETGLRRMLLFDCESREVSDALIDSPVVYFNEGIVMLPVEDEEDYLREEIAKRIEGWGLPSGWENRVRLRLRVAGFTKDKSRVGEVLRHELAEFDFYDEGGADLSQLSHTGDADRDHIALEVREWVDRLAWPQDPPEPKKDQIMAQALKVIYGAD